MRPTPEKLKQGIWSRSKIESAVRDEDSDGEEEQEDDGGLPTRGEARGASAGLSPDKWENLGGSARHWGAPPEPLIPDKWENFERVSSSAGRSALNESASMSSSFKRKGIMSMISGSDKR